MLIKIIERLDGSSLITIEYLGENESGVPCRPCGGTKAIATITKKRIFGKLWQVGKPQEVDLLEFDKYMATGLFIKK